MKSVTSSLTKVCVYDCLHTNTKTVFSKKLKTTNEYEVCDVTVMKVFVYDCPHEDVKTAVSKVSTLECVFECMRLG